MDCNGELFLYSSSESEDDRQGWEDSFSDSDPVSSSSPRNSLSPGKTVSPCRQIAWLPLINGLACSSPSSASSTSSTSSALPQERPIPVADAKDLADPKARCNQVNSGALHRVQKDLKLLSGPVSSTNKLTLLSKLLEEVSDKDVGVDVATALVRGTNDGTDIFDAFESILRRFKSRPFEEIERRCLRKLFRLLGDVLVAFDASLNVVVEKRIKLKVFRPLLNFCRGVAQLSPDQCSKINSELTKLAKEGSLVG